jgi:hypothetical protein
MMSSEMDHFTTRKSIKNPPRDGEGDREAVEGPVSAARQVLQSHNAANGPSALRGGFLGIAVRDICEGKQRILNPDFDVIKIEQGVERPLI